MREESSEGTLLVYCPRCGEKTDRIRVYHAPNLFFAFVGWAWAVDKVVGCPTCVRDSLLKRTLMNFVTANVLCWLTVPWLFVLYIHSCFEGEPGIPAGYEYLADAAPPPRAVDTHKGLRSVVVFLILLLVLVAVFLVPWLLNR